MKLPILCLLSQTSMHWHTTTNYRPDSVVVLCTATRLPLALPSFALVCLPSYLLAYLQINLLINLDIFPLIPNPKAFSHPFGKLRTRITNPKSTLLASLIFPPFHTPDYQPSSSLALRQHYHGGFTGLGRQDGTVAYATVLWREKEGRLVKIVEGREFCAERI